MEYPCHQCEAVISEGVTFCPHCNAPQIRVVCTSVALPETANDARSFSPTLPLDIPADPTAIVWARALPATVLAGLIAAVLMIIPFGLGTLIAGALSVMFYRRRNPAAHITPGMGARLGAVSGMIGFVFFSIFTALGIVVFRLGGQFREALMKAVEQSAARSSDPQAQQAVEFLKTPSGLTFMLVCLVIFLFVLFLVLSSLGGALGAWLQGRREQR